MNISMCMYVTHTMVQIEDKIALSIFQDTHTKKTTTDISLLSTEHEILRKIISETFLKVINTHITIRQDIKKILLKTCFTI